MNRITLTLAALALAVTATTASAWGYGYSYTCTDGYSWVNMVYAQPVGSSCTVRMNGGWLYYGYTM